jgi:hypothetical protein
MKRAWAIGVLVCGMMLAGCAADRNERLAIGTRPTPSFGPAKVRVDAETVERTTRPRREWDTTVVVLAMDGVVHGPTLRTSDRVGRRARADTVGVFPDARRETRSGSDEVRAISGWGQAVMELGLMPARALGAGLAGWEDWSPRRVWKRRPADRVPTASVPALREDADDRRP